MPLLHYRDATVNTDAVNLLCHLHSHSFNLSSIASEPLVSILIDFLGAGHPPALNQIAVKALTLLNVSNATYLSVLNDTEKRRVLTCCLQPSTAEQNQFATSVLARISRDKESWGAVPAAHSDTMQALLTLLAYDEDFSVRQSALEAIAFFALESHNKTLIAEAGGVQAIVYRLKDTEKTIQLIAAAALVNLVRGNSDNKDIINTTRGVLYLIGLLDVPEIPVAFITYAIQAVAHEHQANSDMVNTMGVSLDTLDQYTYSEDDQQKFTAQECIRFFATQRAPTTNDSMLSQYLCCY